MSNILLSDLDAKVQYDLRNIVGSPITQTMRLSVYNDVIDYLQVFANWEGTKRIAPFDFLNLEQDYSLANTLLVTDFKQYRDLRFINDADATQLKEFEEVDGNKFALALGQNTFNNIINFEQRDNDTIMRVLSDIGQGNTLIDEMDDLTTGRTWASDTTTSGATTLVADSTRFKTGGACLRFNITPSQSVNLYARISTTTIFTSTIDASALVNFGYFRFWLGLHSLSAANLANITSITLIWGSDSSNYYTQTTTATITGGSFQATWNRVNFNWAGAAQTGTPVTTALAYFEIRVNYNSGFTSSNNVRVDQIEMFNPAEAELVYFSSNMVKSGTSFKEHFSSNFTGTETMLLSYRCLNFVKALALQRLFPMKERNSADYQRITDSIPMLQEQAVLIEGEAITREKNEFQVDGLSSGRDDTDGNQW